MEQQEETPPSCSKECLRLAAILEVAAAAFGVGLSAVLYLVLAHFGYPQVGRFIVYGALIGLFGYFIGRIDMISYLTEGHFNNVAMSGVFVVTLMATVGVGYLAGHMLARDRSYCQ